MPLLKREPDVFPPDLFDSGRPEPWLVAHVRSRQEKVLARYLRAMEIPHYVPQREKKVRRSGRLFVSYLPLFPGYVFFRPSGMERSVAWESGVVVRLIDAPDPARLQMELAQLERLQRSGATLVPYAALCPGEPVRVVDGPFEDYVGVVLRDRGAERLLVSVSLLRKTVAVEFEREMLAPVPPRAAASPSAGALTA
jgi:transcription antitermination factor NusG